MTSDPTPVEFVVDGLCYSGLRWGDLSRPCVLALHGWLDNALSFAHLAPLLSSYHVLALDLSGHGLSSHRSPDASYHIWDDIPQLMAIADRLGHQRFAVLGHSRGATIAALLAAVLGERCAGLIMIDGLLPAFFDDRDTGEQLRKFVAQRHKYTTRGERIFDSVEAFAERRKVYGFDPKSALVMAPRSLEETDAGFRLRSDPRLFGASVLTLQARDRKQIYQAVAAPTLAVLASSGLVQRPPHADIMLSEASENLVNFETVTITGGHHLHLEDDAGREVSVAIEQFLAEFFEERA